MIKTVSKLYPLHAISAAPSLKETNGSFGGTELPQLHLGQHWNLYVIRIYFLVLVNRILGDSNW